MFVLVVWCRRICCSESADSAAVRDHECHIRFPGSPQNRVMDDLRKRTVEKPSDPGSKSEGESDPVSSFGLIWSLKSSISYLLTKEIRQERGCVEILYKLVSQLTRRLW